MKWKKERECILNKRFLEIHSVRKMNKIFKLFDNKFSHKARQISRMDFK